MTASMTDHVVWWLAVNAVLFVGLDRIGRTKMPWHRYPAWAWAIAVPMMCLIGIPVLFWLYFGYLVLLQAWDTAILRLVGFLVARIPKDDRSPIRQRILLWASKRLAAYVTRWLGAP